MVSSLGNEPPGPPRRVPPRAERVEDRLLDGLHGRGEEVVEPRPRQHLEPRDLVFAGLAERLDYIQDLGVNTVWLLPFYPSPLRDDGYDIADYKGVHPDYGTLADARAFIREAHRRGIRVITELVEGDVVLLKSSNASGLLALAERVRISISLDDLAVAEPISRAARADTPLRVGVVSRTIFYLPAWTAQAQGFFRQQGVDVAIESVPGAEAAVIQRKGERYEHLAAAGEMLFPGAARFIRGAAEAGIPIAIASGALTHEIEDVLERAGLRLLFPVEMPSVRAA